MKADAVKTRPAPSDFEPKSSYDYDDLLRCGRGELFGPNNPQLPSPPLLMFDRITDIHAEGGAHNKGFMRAVLDVKPSLWFFSCHFKDDPVMPGCLGLDALWQMVGFFLGWRGGQGRGRALGVGKVRFTGMVLPDVREIEYKVDLKRVILGRMTMGIADGAVLAEGTQIYTAQDLRVGLFTQTQGEGEEA